MNVDPATGPNPVFVWIRDAAGKLAAIGAGNPRLEAEYLMAAALRIPRIRLWLHDSAPAEEEIVRFEALLTRRLTREPLQYVLGTAEFAGLALAVGPGVLIPRSETEVLVERAASILLAHRDSVPSPRIVDVGTGSGAILLALLDRIPSATGLGIDIEPETLVWARRNAERPGLEGRVRFAQGDLLDGLGRGSFDAVVSNPPYIARSEIEALAPEIRDHEPSIALFAGEDGLDLIRRLIPQADDLLPSGGLLTLEIGITQAEAVQELLTTRAWGRVKVTPDWTGRPRVVTAHRV